MAAAQTLPSRQRARVLETYRSRGRRNSNLWLVYSVKQDQDILLHSDRSLVHWLAFLETDPSVLSFRPAPEEVLAQLEVERSTATLIERQDHRLELHLVACGTPAIDVVDTGVGMAQVRMVTLDELQGRARLALRWMKAIGYAGLYRSRDVSPVLNQLIAYMMQRAHGSVDDLAAELLGMDRPSLYAALVKAAITGQVELDLTAHGLCGTTQWSWRLHKAG
jgi:hypothetical protein